MRAPPWDRLAIVSVTALTAFWMALPRTAGAQEHADEPGRAMRSIRDREPTATAVREMALRYAGLWERPERAWSFRSRAAGALPQLSLRGSRNLSSDNDLSRIAGGTERYATGSNSGLAVELRAVWDLDRLVFDPSEIRSASLAERLHRARMAVLAQVNSIYYRRRRAQLQLLYRPPDEPEERALLALEIDEATAQLDALTGGRFSSASGDRPRHR